MKTINQSWEKELFKIAEDDLSPGEERVTIILNSDVYDRLKSISDIKGIFVKDIVNNLIEIYNSVAITDKDKQNIEKEKTELEKKIKELVDLQEEVK